MEIQCECGKFRAELSKFPKSTPGRLICYCDDCQSYLHYLKRADLLDKNGGTEIIPNYPADVKIVAGKELIKCTRVVPNGMFRFATTCCNTPIANTEPNRPWAGFHRRMFTSKDPNKLEQSLGPVKSSIMGKYAKGTPPPGTPQKFSFKGMKLVLPYILKGILLKKANPSPFFRDSEPIVPPKVLSTDELHAARTAAGLAER
jgi:hypothetical protein